jgi:hypothetical protein
MYASRLAAIVPATSIDMIKGRDIPPAVKTGTKVAAGTGTSRLSPATKLIINNPITPKSCIKS